MRRRNQVRSELEDRLLALKTDFDTTISRHMTRGTRHALWQQFLAREDVRELSRQLVCLERLPDWSKNLPVQKIE